MRESSIHEKGVFLEKEKGKKTNHSFHKAMIGFHLRKN
jgi:hypothetical protein